MAELSTIARPYAEALFEALRQEPATLNQWSDRLSEMAQVAELSDVQEALTRPTLSNAQRFELFSALLKTPLDQTATNFIQLLIDNERLLALPQIAEQFNNLKHKLEGSAIVRITSAFPMGDAELQKLVAALEKKFGLKLEPVVTVDADLIGGVRVMVGDQVLDTSVQAQLARMRDTLAAA